MRGVEPVNDEVEVGFNQDFETAWYRTEVIGRCVMIGFACAAMLGLLGRGPLSHASARSLSGTFRVDYEPVARDQTPTLVTFHIDNPGATSRAVDLSLAQEIVQPMGFRRAVPLAVAKSVGDRGMTLHYIVEPHQSDALVPLQLQTETVCPVTLHASDGVERVDWTMFVVP